MIFELIELPKLFEKWPGAFDLHETVKSIFDCFCCESVTPKVDQQPADMAFVERPVIGLFAVLALSDILEVAVVPFHDRSIDHLFECRPFSKFKQEFHWWGPPFAIASRCRLALLRDDIKLRSAIRILFRRPSLPCRSAARRPS